MAENYSVNHEALIGTAATVAQRAAIAASEAVLAYWPSPTNPLFSPDRGLEITSKEGIGNFSTAADHASNAIIKGVIGQYPELAELDARTEESEPTLHGDSGLWWNIDEIDGTANFSRGDDHFGVSIGLHNQTGPVLGVVAFPGRRQLIAAQRGHGAKLMDFDGRTLVDLAAHAASLSSEPSADQLFIAYDLGYQGQREQILAGPAKLADRVSALKTFHSSSYSLGEVALGTVDAFFYASPTIYDIGASTAIIEAIGGKVSDMSGNPIDWNASERTFLAARTPQIHALVLAMLHEA